MDMDQHPESNREASSPGYGKTIPPGIRKAVEGLAHRYPATASTPIDERQKTLRLLAEDLADMNPSLLERVIAIHVRNSPYMPKLSDIAHLAKGLLEAEAPRGTAEQFQRMAKARNERMETEPGARQDIRWVGDQHGLRLVPRSQLNARPEPKCTPEQAAAIMKEFGIKSSILDPIVNALKPARRNPTEAGIAELKREMGIPTPQAEAADHG